MRELGVTYQLGHRIGEGCTWPSIPVDLTIFDISSVTAVCIKYCYCGEPGEQKPPRIQLLRTRWFPATLKQPGTAFTFRFLDHLHKLQTQSKINLYDVYATLVSIHNASGLNPQIVSEFFLLTVDTSCSIVTMNSLLPLVCGLTYNVFAVGVEPTLMADSIPSPLVLLRSTVQLVPTLERTWSPVPPISE